MNHDVVWSMDSNTNAFTFRRVREFSIVAHFISDKRNRLDSLTKNYPMYSWIFIEIPPYFSLGHFYHVIFLQILMVYLIRFFAILYR